jgi:flagellar basal body P-ring formation chaperone FlgA
MKSKSRSALLGVAIFTGACFGVSTNAMRIPRIELLREVRVTGARVLLSDLLPAGAGVSLRGRAEEISLGAAPQPGNTRVLERSGVLGNIGASQDVVTEIAVPERIVVSRDARPITLQEVFAAIRKALERSEISAAANLHLDDILLQTQVLVGPGDAGLEVLRSDFDAGLKRARFLLWPSQDPKVLPFFVAVRFSGNSPLAILHSVTEPSRTASKPELPLVPALLAKAEVLVSPGERATLILRSDALRMIADVVPLERGTMGQQIHVRVLDTGKIFSAQVDGRAHLEVKF